MENILVSTVFIISGFFIIAALLLIFLRMTVRKKTRELLDSNKLLKENEEKYRLLTENIKDIVWVLDTETMNFLYVSPSVEIMLGYTPDEVISKTFDYPVTKEESAILGKKMQHELEDFQKGRITSNTYSTNEVEQLCKDGSKVWTEVIANYYKNPATNKIELRGVTRDISERKKSEAEKKELEAKLRQSQKIESIGTLAGGIAHDFNNILFPIIGFAEMSIEDLPESHPVRENLEDILQGAKRARDLVKQILSFSNQRDIKQKNIMFKPLIEETIKLLRSIIPSNIEIKQDLHNEAISIFANAAEIHEIIMNICTNAYHAVEKEGGAIKISLDKSNPGPDIKLPEKDYCCLSVSDTGAGISPEIMEKIFDPYFTTKEQGKGSGLGLSVIHGIVKSYKGAIDIKSELGKGTRVDVFLPLALDNVASSDNIYDLADKSGDEHILFVDDEESIVKLVERLLERMGYTVTGKTSSTDAMQVFEADPDRFDLVITDMAMPLMQGTELAEKILKIRDNLPILICTGFSEQIDKNNAISYGIKGYINKPILMDDLTLKVRKILDDAKKGEKCRKF